MKNLVSNENMGKATKQVNEILKTMPSEYIEKINKNFLIFLNETQDVTYDFTFNDINEKKLLPETEMILQILYRNYWCSPEEAEEIDRKMNENEKIYNEEQKEIYNIDKIFNKRSATKIEENKNSYETNNNNSMVVYEKGLFKKVLDFIKKLFKR